MTRTSGRRKLRPMIASTVRDIALGGGLTLANVLVGLVVVLVVKHLLRGQPV
jgi:hypothetical protein